MKLKLAILISLFLFGCKASYYCNKCKEKGIVKIDTVFQERIIPGEKTSIEVPIDRLVNRDTVIYQDRVKLHYVTLRDTLRLTVECPPDTIRVPVTVHESISCPPEKTTWRTVALALGVLLILLVFFVARR